MSTITVQIVSDFVCPWCYVGKRRLDTALAQFEDMDVKISWLPFQLSPDMPPEGKNRKQHYDSIFGAQKAATIMADMAETGKEEGIAFTYTDDAMSPNTLMAHKLMFRAAEQGVDTDSLAEKLFEAHHVHCRNIGDVDVLAELAASEGMDAAEVSDYLSSGEDGEIVANVMKQLRTEQVSGVPFIVLDGRLALSGAQPVDVFVKALNQLQSLLQAESA